MWRRNRQPLNCEDDIHVTLPLCYPVCRVYSPTDVHPLSNTPSQSQNNDPSTTNRNYTISYSTSPSRLFEAIQSLQYLPSTNQTLQTNTNSREAWLMSHSARFPNECDVWETIITLHNSSPLQFKAIVVLHLPAFPFSSEWVRLVRKIQLRAFVLPESKAVRLFMIKKRKDGLKRVSFSDSSLPSPSHSLWFLSTNHLLSRKQTIEKHNINAFSNSL